MDVHGQDTGATGRAGSPPPPTGAPGGNTPAPPRPAPGQWPQSTPLQQPQKEGGMSTGAKVGLVVGVLVLMAGSFVVGWFVGAATTAVSGVNETFGDLDVGIGGDRSELPGGFVADETFSGRVSGGGEATYKLDVSTAGLLRVHVTSSGDTRARLLDSDDAEVGFSDDGIGLDPYFEVDVEPGTYTLVVEPWGFSDGDDFTAAIDTP